MSGVLQQILSQNEYDERKDFIEKLGSLVKSEHEEIFRIIKKADDQWSENSNGIFFDVSTLKKDTFDKLKSFMNFCMENRKEQEQRQKEMDALRTNGDFIDTT
jgi:hypothetical protein